MAYQDTWHLDDIGSHDLDNLKALLKKEVKKTYYKEVNQVVMASGLMVSKALEKHGISLEAAAKVDEERAGEVIDQLLKNANVRVEERMEYKGIDQWRCGIYIYKDNEIADFIGAPKNIDSRIDSFYRFTMTSTIVL